MVPKAVYRILGNFGVGVASPFVGASGADVLNVVNFTWEQIVMICLLGGIFTGILSASREALARGAEAF